MRIAVNAVLLRQHDETGVELYIRALLRHLARVDQKNEYLVFTNREAVCKEIEQNPRFRIYRTRFAAGQRWRRILWEQHQLPGILREMAVDVFHAPAYVMPLRCPVPCVATMHDILAITDPHFCRRMNVLHYRFMLPRTARRAAHIIASSEATKDAILERLQAPNERVTVIYPGVDESFCPQTSPASQSGELSGYALPDHYILFVGRLEPKKNVTALLRAYAWLRQNRNIAQKLILVGPAECWDPSLPKAIRELALKEDIIRLPYLPANILRQVYNRADVFVFPSLAEGFGFPPLEAMASGTPVVASNIPVLRETLGDAAITVPPDQPHLLAIAIQKVLSNSFLRRTLIARGLARVKKFNWTDAARKIVALYEQVASDLHRRV